MSLFSRVGNTPSAINTTAANTFGGQTPSATTAGLGGVAGGSLFGQGAASQAPATAGLFGQTTSAAAPSGGLFGQTPTATTSAPAAGGLFGATTTSAPAAGGLFGASTATAATPAATAGGLFGATPTPAASTAPAAGGLFGASTAAPAAPATGGLFGGQPASQPAASAGGMFGQQQGQKPATGLFGQSSVQQPAGNILLSSTAQQPQASLYAQPQPSQQQAVEMNFTNMRGTTRYEELHQEVKTILEYFDDYIQKSIGISQELSARSVSHKEAMESVDADVELVSRKLGYTSAFLNNDGHSIGQLHSASTELINTATLSTRTIDILRLPISQRSHYLSTHHTSNPEYSLIPYFEEKTREIEGKTENFLATVGEVERTLQAIERDIGTVDMSAENKAREVAKAEKFVFQGMISVAEKVAVLNENLKSVTR